MGTVTAPVAGSGSWPAWIARVSKASSSMGGQRRRRSSATGPAAGRSRRFQNFYKFRLSRVRISGTTGGRNEKGAPMTHVRRNVRILVSAAAALFPLVAGVGPVEAVETCDGLPATLVGSSFADVLQGTSAAEVI